MRCTDDKHSKQECLLNQTRTPPSCNRLEQPRQWLQPGHQRGNTRRRTRHAAGINAINAGAKTLLDAERARTHRTLQNTCMTSPRSSIAKWATTTGHAPATRPAPDALQFAAVIAAQNSQWICDKTSLMTSRVSSQHNAASTTHAVGSTQQETRAQRAQPELTADNADGRLQRQQQDHSPTPIFSWYSPLKMSSPWQPP